MVAETVRYERRARADGRIRRYDVIEAIKIRRAWIASGRSYDRKLPQEKRVLVFAAKGTRCALCAALATEIDHIDGAGPDDLSNFQPLCSDCHCKKTLSKVVAIGPDHPAYDEVKKRLCEYEARVLSKSPIRACDDEKGWMQVQRAVSRARRSFVISMMPRPEHRTRRTWPINDWVEAIPIGKALDVTDMVTSQGASLAGFQSAVNKKLREHGLVARICGGTGKVYVTHPEELPQRRRRGSNKKVEGRPSSPSLTERKRTRNA